MIKTDNKKHIAALVKAYKKGDSGAFLQLYEETFAHAKYIAQGIVKNIDDAEDIVQDSYLAAIEKIGDLREPSKFLSWFYKIVSNKAKNYSQKMKPDFFKNKSEEQNALHSAYATDESTPQESIEKQELNEKLDEIIRSLTYEQGVSVMLYYFDGLSLSEIAEITGVSSNLVKQRLWSARKKIKKEMENSEDKDGNKLFALLPFPGLFASKIFRHRVLSSGYTLSTAGGSSAGGTVAAKTVAMTAVHKAVAGIAAVAVIGGSSAGTAVMVKNRKNEIKSAGTAVTDYSGETQTVFKAFTATFTAVETVTTFAEVNETVSVLTSQTVQTDSNSTSGSGNISRKEQKESNSNKPVSSTSQKETTTKHTTKGRKNKEYTTGTTAQKRTESTSVSTTSGTRRETTSREQTTHNSPEAAAPTEKPTETASTKAKAEIYITVVKDGGATTVGTFTKTIDAGEKYSFSDAEADAKSRYGGQHDFTYVYSYGTDASSGAEAGKTYSITVDI